MYQRAQTYLSGLRQVMNEFETNPQVELSPETKRDMYNIIKSGIPKPLKKTRDDDAVAKEWELLRSTYPKVNRTILHIPSEKRQVFVAYAAYAPKTQPNGKITIKYQYSVHHYQRVPTLDMEQQHWITAYKRLTNDRVKHSPLPVQCCSSFDVERMVREHALGRVYRQLIATEKKNNEWKQV